MSYLEKYNAWRNSPDIDEADRAELASIEGNDTEIKERFICDQCKNTRWEKRYQ